MRAHERTGSALGRARDLPQLPRVGGVKADVWYWGALVIEEIGYREVLVGLRGDRLSQPLEAVLWGDLARQRVLEERIRVEAKKTTFVEATALNVLSEDVQHARSLAGSWVVLVLKLIHFKDVCTPVVVDNEVDAREAFIALAAELYSGFAFKAHPDARQEPRDPLLFLLLSLLTAFCMYTAKVLLEDPGAGKGRVAAGTCVRTLARV